MRGALALVTGGAGFIGSTLVRRLRREGVGVRVFDDFSTGTRANLEGVEGVEVVEGDVVDFGALRAAARGADLFFHLAALPSVVRSIEDPLATEAANARGTMHAVLAAREAGVSRFVYASSSSVYGNAPRLPKREEDPLDPVSPYGASKAVGELWVRAFARLDAFPGVVLRFFNVFGPRQRADSPYSGVIARFAQALSRGEPGAIEGDGLQTRDFTFVEDAVAATVLAARVPLDPGELLNVAAGVETSVNELYETLAELAGSNASARRAPPRPGDVRHSRASIERARSRLGYAPRFALREGLQRTLAWYPEASS